MSIELIEDCRISELVISERFTYLTGLFLRNYFSDELMERIKIVFFSSISLVIISEISVHQTHIAYPIETLLRTLRSEEFTKKALQNSWKLHKMFTLRSDSDEVLTLLGAQS